MKKEIIIVAIILFSVNLLNSQEKKENLKKIETRNWLDLTFRVLNEKGEEMPFSCVEQMPDFPGGYNALAKFITDTLEYPISAIRDSVEGNVITRFAIDKNGKVCNVITLKGVRNDLDSTCVKAISLMPNWTRPKLLDVDDEFLIQFVLPIKFRLE